MKLIFFRAKYDRFPYIRGFPFQDAIHIFQYNIKKSLLFIYIIMFDKRRFIVYTYSSSGVAADLLAPGRKQAFMTIAITCLFSTRYMRFQVEEEKK